MKNYKFVVERTQTGFSAFAEDENLPVFTTGKDFEEIKTNILEALNLYLEHAGKKAATAENIITKLDLPSFFEFYSIINAKALSKRINMNESLLSQYVNGKKEPSEKQIQKILTGIKDLGKELMQLEIA
ncbi:XRE family transcriptional regulator [Kaistella haifensis]|uniref:Transcriptional regulator n=1 Tax=Kaistella haifensis DSM 19056 TaxID=1450526 RepID=A0A246BAJ3_9FLAO|nr:helix-turn-helix transcriptional regulator [Kaistella haifensis]AZB22476.1 XRE family transcriptional regulator [Kaistella haifensis]OWK98712.1 transcriptional regulator [Kaistella haifensis DSM 19056]ROI11541.1 XRE family transcriptional regulator [Kaistella haifensis]